MSVVAQLKKKALSLPMKPGVYIMKSVKNEVIYVGKAKNLKNRVSSYFRNLVSHNEKTHKMVGSVYDFDFIVTKSEFEALILECSLIKQNKPKYNVLLKDSKGFCFVKITKNLKFPKISVVKKKENDSAIYLGPYVQYSHLFPIKQAVQNVNEIFMLPDCNWNFNGKFKKRPCLNFYIKKCMGVCCGKVLPDDYVKIVEEAIDFLKNGSENSIEEMKKQMNKAANNLNFELAIKFRDRIKSIEKINQKSSIYLNNEKSVEVISSVQIENLICFVVVQYLNGKIKGLQHFFCESFLDFDEEFEDFFATYYYGKNKNSYDVPDFVVLDCKNFKIELFEKYLKTQFGVNVEIKLPSFSEDLKILAEMAHSNAVEILTTHFKQGSGKFKLINDLTKTLHLEITPSRIEAYDISNFGNSVIVGAMVVFQNGWALNSNYRKFKMKTVFYQDDYSAISEIIKRRILQFKKQNDISFSQKPNLILIDGGKGHVNLVKKILISENFNVPCFGMIKDAKHKTRALTDGLCEINLAVNVNLFGFISQIQEEVHRFVIDYGRKSFNKSSLKLELTKIKGVGKARALKLINFLKTSDNLNKVDVVKIADALKINLKLAKKIKNFLCDFSI